MITKLSILGLVALLGFQAPAAADSSYRYWSFWVVKDGSWRLSPVGAGSTPATAGEVQGWRFVTAGVAVDLDLAPRTSTSFNEICSAEKSKSHIAVVIDYGLARDYSSDVTPPELETFCMKTDSKQNSLITLSRNVEIREDAGFICALNGFPKTGCAEPADIEIKTANPSNTDKSESELPIFGYVIAVTAFIASLTAIVRRNKSHAK